MKKFFKALAVVMALTLVIGTIPASAATVNAKTAKKLYIGGAKGEDANGVKSSVKKSVTYAKLLGITKEEAADAKVTAKSSDKTIAKANNDKQKVYAKKIGKATVTVTYKGKDYKVKVTVKKNADSVKFGGDWAGVEDTFEAETGTEYTVSLPRLDGSTKLDTDQRRLEASDESVVIAAKEEQPRAFTVKFTKPGEFTVTGIAYQSKTYNAATASKAVTVTVKAGAFDAQVTGRRTFTAYGTFSDATVFSVKRGNTDVKVTAKVAEDGKSATLETEAKLTKATYTVSDGANSVDIAVEDEIAKEILILEQEDNKPVKTADLVNGVAKDTVYVHYKVLNQYGEDATKYFAVNWTTTYGAVAKDDRNEGVLTITDNGLTPATLNYGTIIVITGTHTSVGNVVTKTAQLTAGLDLTAGSVEFVGIRHNSTKKITDTLPVEFNKDEYSIVFKLYDQDGYALAYHARYNNDLTFTSMSPLLLSVANSIDGTSPATIEGTEYPTVKITDKGFDVKKGGKALIRVVSKSGNQSDLEVTVNAAQTLASFKFETPDFDIIDYPGNAYTLPYDARDTEGNPITSFTVLRAAVSLVGTNLWLEENNDGSASLKYNPQVGATRYTDIPAMLMATVTSSTGASTEQITLNVKADAYVNEVKNLVVGHEDLYIVEGGSQRLNTSQDWSGKNRLVYFDQYSNETEFTTSVADNKAGDIQVGASYTGNNLGIVSYESDGTIYSWNDVAATIGVTGTSATTRTSVLAPQYGYFMFYAKDGVTTTKSEEVVEFYLYNPDLDGTDKTVGGSQKKFVYNIVDVSMFSGFSLAGGSKLGNDIDATAWDGSGNLKDTYTAEVKGDLSGASTKITIPHKYVVYTRSISSAINGTAPAAFAATGNAVTAFTFTPGATATIFRKTMPGYAPATTVETQSKDKDSQNSFFDYKQPATNGAYPSRFVTVNLLAEVHVASGTGLGVLQGTAKNTVSVGIHDSHIQEFVKGGDGWSVIWTDQDKGLALVKAASGVITRNDLLKLIGNHWSPDTYKKAIDNYGQTRAINPANIKLEITNYVETAGNYSDATKDKQLDNGAAGPGFHKITANGTTGTETIKVENAEIGDTFKLVFSYDGATLEATVTVGSDKDAKINPNNNKPSWY